MVEMCVAKDEWYMFLLVNKSRGADLLVLVGGDGGEDGLGEAEGLHSLAARHRLVRRELAAEVLPDDVNTRLVLVHGVEDDLKAWKGEKGEVQPLSIWIELMVSEKAQLNRVGSTKNRVFSFPSNFKDFSLWSLKGKKKH